MTPTTLSRVINDAEVALAAALRIIPAAKILWPSLKKQDRWAELTSSREPLVTGVIAFADGKNLRVAQPSDVDLQNAQYNGLSNMAHNETLTYFAIIL